MWKINYKRGDKWRSIKFELKGRPYMDNIFEITPILLTPADTLEVSVDLEISLEVDGVKTSSKTEKYTYLMENLTEAVDARFIRFTRLRKKACIEVLTTMPDDLYRPNWNAKKVK